MAKDVLSTDYIGLLGFYGCMPKAPTSKVTPTFMFRTNYQQAKVDVWCVFLMLKYRHGDITRRVVKLSVEILDIND